VAIPGLQKKSRILSRGQGREGPSHKNENEELTPTNSEVWGGHLMGEKKRRRGSEGSLGKRKKKKREGAFSTYARKEFMKKTETLFRRWRSKLQAITAEIYREITLFGAFRQGRHLTGER